MENITAVRVTSDFGEIDRLIEIYTEAFPPQERKFTIRQMLKFPVFRPEINAYYDEGKLIGLSVLRNMGPFVYLLFFAVDRKERNSGYGGKVLDKIIGECGDKPLVLAIEDPSEECDNKEQRVKREAFYLRHNCEYTGHRARYPGNDTYFRLMSSRKLDGHFCAKFILRLGIILSELMRKILRRHSR